VDVYLHNPVFSCLVGILTVQLELYVKCPNFPPNKFVVLFFNTEDGGTIFFETTVHSYNNTRYQEPEYHNMNPNQIFLFPRMMTKKKCSPYTSALFDGW